MDTIHFAVKRMKRFLFSLKDKFNTKPSENEKKPSKNHKSVRSDENSVG